MGRRKLVADEALLQAARQVFVEQGLQATTAGIALRAGLSEAALLKRHGSKVGLFHAALGTMFRRPMWWEAEEEEGASVEDRLAALAERGALYFRTLVPLMMMAW